MCTSHLPLPPSLPPSHSAVVTHLQKSQICSRRATQCNVWREGSTWLNQSKSDFIFPSISIVYTPVFVLRPSPCPWSISFHIPTHCYISLCVPLPLAKWQNKPKNHPFCKVRSLFGTPPGVGVGPFVARTSHQNWSIRTPPQSLRPTDPVNVDQTTLGWRDSRSD